MPSSCTYQVGLPAASYTKTTTGFVYSPRSAPWFDYDPGRFVVGEAVGSMTLDFDGERAARMSFATGSKHVSRNLQPQDFTGDRPSPMDGLADMWWGGPSQNGWGIALLEQFGSLFSVWFTYGDDGKPTWFVMPGGEWKDSTTFSGTLYRTSGSAWIERPYDASQLRVGAVGTYAFRFATKDRARFEYSVDGRSGAVELTRQSFD